MGMEKRPPGPEQLGACNAEAASVAEEGVLDEEARGSGEEPVNTGCNVHKHFECSICMQLLCQPVTITCGHTFCKWCLQLNSERSSQCAVCRRQIEGSQLVNTSLDNFLRECYPQEQARRQREHEEEEEQRRAAKAKGSKASADAASKPRTPGQPRYLNVRTRESAWELPPGDDSGWILIPAAV